jgi:hypothetical protein
VFGKVGGRGDGELEKLGEGFRETNKFQADPFGFLVHILFLYLMIWLVGERRRRSFCSNDDDATQHGSRVVLR